ncbi:MAG: alginate lyase family protein [Cyanobacteria bacterium P01_H01_bin.74]
MSFIASIHPVWRFLRTIRHFSVDVLAKRVTLSLKKRLYRFPEIPANFADHWRHYYRTSIDLPRLYQWYNPTACQKNKKTKENTPTALERLLADHSGELLNRPFQLPGSTEGLIDLLEKNTRLWQENYNYLAFLQPAITALASESGYSTPVSQTEREQACLLLETQCMLFWQLPQQKRYWSTYGVSRRLLTYYELLPALVNHGPLFSEVFHHEFWRQYFYDASYQAVLPEVDIAGNHLIKNEVALLSATVVFSQFPSLQAITGQWKKQIMRFMLPAYKSQCLPDGFHFERIPMYHFWVLEDLLNTIQLLSALSVKIAQTPEANTLTALKSIASKWLETAAIIDTHCQTIPNIGDSSRPQVPDPAGLITFGKVLLKKSESPGFFSSESTLIRKTLDAQQQVIWPDAGYTLFSASILPTVNVSDAGSDDASSEDRDTGSLPYQTALIFDCGSFGPKRLPAHSHCDLGSFELYCNGIPFIVDSGISAYAEGKERNYFRSTEAHNTLWVSGHQQAEVWGSFRVAEYPQLIKNTVKPSGNKLESGPFHAAVSYQNYNKAFQHHRQLRQSQPNASTCQWTIEDTVHIAPKTMAARAEAYLLFHLHPLCAVRQTRQTFSIVHKQLPQLVLSLCANQERIGQVITEKTWQPGNPDECPQMIPVFNLYSEGFSLAEAGKLIAFQLPRQNTIQISFTLTLHES